MHMHPSHTHTHMFTCTYKVTLRVFHQNSMQVLPGNWELGGGVLICFSWTFSMATASWCEPVRRDTCGTLTQWQRSSWSSDPIKKQGGVGGWGAGGVEALSSLALLMSNWAKEKPLKIQSNVVCTYLHVTLLLSPEVNGRHDLDIQSRIRTEVADITDNWMLSPQASESFIASFKVNWCLFQVRWPRKVVVIIHPVQLSKRALFNPINPLIENLTAWCVK